MNWGNSLLGLFDIDENVVAFGEAITDLIPGFLYNIWRLLAWIVGGVESIFRNLAGIGGTGKDMITGIIYHDSMDDILGNLIGLSTALIIFFTIIKIIQEHYKEKDGGNPYKIIIRTFKGLLMFFFVQAAVSVGLMTMQTMFKALDAATGSGSTTSIAGQVFKSMAYDANRKRIGVVAKDEGFLSDAKNKYYYRLNSGGSSEYGKYVMIQMNGLTDKDKPKTAAEWREKYFELFPSMQYGVVESDGRVTPISQWIQTKNWGEEDWEDIGKDVENTWNDMVTGDGWDNYSNTFEEDGQISGGVGFKNDILQAFSTTIQPSISLAWSPVDIYNYGFSLHPEDPIEHNINTTVMGTGTEIPMSTTLVRYGDPVITMKSLEDSAKQFGITLDAHVALQGGEATASFDLDVFDKQFDQILTTILLNPLYTNITQKAIEAIPKIPGSTTVYAVEINWLQILGPLIMKLFQSMNEKFLDNLGMIPKDEETGEYLVETFVVGPVSHNAGIWVSVNDQSKYLPIRIERYQIDNNFTDLWGQLTDSFKDLVAQMEDTSNKTWDTYEAEAAALDAVGGKIVDDQSGWTAYYGSVQKYNNDASGLLTRLGNYLNLYEILLNEYPDFVAGYEQGIGTNLVNDLLASKGFPGSWETLADAIKSTFLDLVTAYNQVSPIFSTTRPTNSYADLRIVPSIYQPIIELNMTNNRAEAMSVEEIRNAMFNRDKNNGKVTVNMFLDSNKAYRMIDWSAYCGMSNVTGGIKDVFGNYIDLYNENSIDPKEGHENTALVEHGSIEDLVFFWQRPEAVSTAWDSVGISYFVSNPSFQDGNPFITQTRAGGFNKTFCDSSYWGARGITKGDTRYYIEYMGTSPKVPGTDNSGFAEHSGSTTSALSTASVNSAVRASSANTNAIIAAGKASALNEIKAMADVDTDTQLATEFSKKIVTFRKLGVSDDEQVDKDKKALEDWIDRVPTVEPLGSYNAKMLYNFSAQEIDDIMASSRDGERRYLLLTKKNHSTIGSGAGSFDSYKGVMSYTDTSTVRNLYHIGDMNFAVGYIAIVAATGVYLNFAFGLIQRAVNMAVLYVMSPVTIAFYPFDDGSKFNSQFVTPFYKEAISAFAVIVSLNIFIVMLQPVQTAVEEATGSEMLGWLSLVAFVSMLPQIRNTITSVLGASQMSAKSLGSVFGDAKKAVGYDTMKKAGKLAAGGIDKFGKVLHGAGALASWGKEQRDKLLENAAKRDGKVGSWAKEKLAKKQAKESERKKNQEQLDAAIAKGSKEGLTKQQSRMYDRQVKAAEIEAKRNAGGRLKGETKEQYTARVNEEKDKLLADPNFRKSISGVVKRNRGIRGVKNAIANTRFGIQAQRFGSTVFGKSSILGRAVRDKFGIDGELAKDKNSVIGAGWRLFDGMVKEKRQKEIQAQELKREQFKQEHKENLHSGAGNCAENELEGDQLQYNRAVERHTAKVVAESGKSTAEKYQALLTSKYMLDGLSEEDAELKAKQDIESKQLSAKQLEQEYELLGGDRKVAEGLARGVKGLSSLGLDINLNDNAVKKQIREIEQELREQAAKLGSSSAIQTELINETKNQTEAFKMAAFNMARAMGVDPENKDGKKTVEAIAEVLEKTKPGTNFEALVDKIAGATGISKKKVKDSAESYNDHNKAMAERNIRIDDLKVALEAYKLYEKGKELWNGKMPPDVDYNDQVGLTQVIKNVHDGNLNSTNVNSFGYRANEIILEYEGNGGQDNPDCQERIAALKAQMTAELDAAYASFEAKYAKSIREFALKKKYKEEMDAVTAMSIAPEIQHKIEFYVGTKMQVAENQLLTNDSKIRELEISGDMATAGMVMQKLVDCVRRHDLDGARALGVDESTIDKMVKWEQAGQTDHLDHIHGLGELYTAHMGSLSAAMGGSSILGAETAVARLMAVAKNEEYIKKYQVKLQNLAQNEDIARREVNQVLSQIEDNFSGAMWNELYSELGVAGESGFTEFLRTGLTSVSEGGSYDAENIKKIRTAFNKFRDEHINDPKYQRQLAIADSLTSALARAKEANQYSDEQDMTNTLITMCKAQTQEIIAKTKYFTGEKG